MTAGETMPIASVMASTLGKLMNKRTSKKILSLGLPRPPEQGAEGGAVGATRKNRAGPVSLYSRSPHKCPSHRDGVLWGDPATAGTARFFQTVGRAPAADVPQSAATGTKGCSLAGLVLTLLEDLNVRPFVCF